MMIPFPSNRLGATGDCLFRTELQTGKTAFAMMQMPRRNVIFIGNDIVDRTDTNTGMAFDTRIIHRKFHIEFRHSFHK